MRLKWRAKQLWEGLRRNLLSRNAWPVIAYYRYIWKPKPGSLDEILDDFSRHHRRINFIQIGSNDGMKNDPLYKFIKRDGWAGVLLEPQTKVFEKLTRFYRKDAVIPLNKALSHQDGEQDFFQISFSQARWATGLSSFVRDHLTRKIADGYVERKSREEGVKPPDDRETWIKTLRVETVSYLSLRSHLPADVIDLLHIDTEGFDYEVLKLIDFSTGKPGMIIFEKDSLSPEDVRRSRELLKGHGYGLIDLGADMVAKL